MSKFVSLLKATMSGGLQLFNYRGKTERSRRIMPLLLGTLIGIMMLMSATTTTMGLAEDGEQAAILSIYTIITAFIIVMEGSYKASDLLFKPKNNDTLLAMPIEKSTIIFARMIKFYAFEMVYCLIFLLPAIIAYAMNTEVDASFGLVAVTMLILVPVIPIAVSCVVGLIISAVSGRFKHKTLLQVVLSFAVLFASVGLVFLVNLRPDFDGQSMAAFNNKVIQFYYPAVAFVRLATSFSIWEYLLFVMVNMVVLVITVVVISRFCFQIITKLSTVSRVEKVDSEYSFARHSQTAAMVRKEMNRYFNTPVLLLNTAMGLVFFVVAVGALCLKFDEFANSIMSSAEDFPLTIDEMRSFLPGVTFVMVAFASLLTCITATMISLEGRALNVLKVLPISGKKVIITKVLAAMLLIVPVTLIGCFVMFFRFQFSAVDAILIIIGAITMPLVTELIGILINLKYPRFDADNDTVVVKQSASVMMATFIGLGMLLVTASLTFTTILLAGQTAGLAMMDGVYIVVSSFLYFVVAMRGEEYYMRLIV